MASGGAHCLQQRAAKYCVFKTDMNRTKIFIQTDLFLTQKCFPFRILKIIQNMTRTLKAWDDNRI
jgi:hypothetical protein